jgi:hypothetical protein
LPGFGIALCLVLFSSLEPLCHSYIQQFSSTVVTTGKDITEGYDFLVACGNGQYFWSKGPEKSILVECCKCSEGICSYLTA